MCNNENFTSFEGFVAIEDASQALKKVYNGQ